MCLQRFFSRASELYYPQHPRFRALENGHPSKFNFEAAIREKDELVASLRESNYIRIARELKVPVVEGRARFVSYKRIEAMARLLRRDKFIIATGSKLRILPFKGIEKVNYITNQGGIKSVTATEIDDSYRRRSYRS